MSPFQNIDPAISNKLYLLKDEEVLSYIDVHFACFIAERALKHPWEAALGSALVSRSRNQGHICLDLSRVNGAVLLERTEDTSEIRCPEMNDWSKRLLDCGVVGRPGEDREFMPLILDDSYRLYLNRYFNYQEKLSSWINSRSGIEFEDFQADETGKSLSRIFSEESPGRINMQKVAAFAALNKSFCVITGGPGTGKSTAAAGILSLLLEVNPEQRIVLAAPTGKAAGRLTEAIKNAKKRLDCDGFINSLIPEEASTIHRLLGFIPGSPQFRHRTDNPIPADIVVIDEASMVDLALMSKLVQAIKPETRLILLGDKNQLSSVEAGAVLGDICDAGEEKGFSRKFAGKYKESTAYDLPIGKSEESGLGDSVIQLTKNYRFHEDSGIGMLSSAVCNGDERRALSLLEDRAYKDVGLENIPSPSSMKPGLEETVKRECGELIKIKDPGKAFESYNSFRVLCALREGPYGVIVINRVIEKIIEEMGAMDREGTWYSGRPVMITRNDYSSGLFNGDVGIALPDPESGNELRVFFQALGGDLRKFNPIRLPEHETVFAMTVHKSQGSEFDRVLMILSERDSPVLTRELLYTGITRAREQVKILSPEHIFRSAVLRPSERISGLRDSLKGEIL